MRCSLYMYIFTHVYSQYSLQARQLLLKFPEYVNLLISRHPHNMYMYTQKRNLADPFGRNAYDKIN